MDRIAVALHPLFSFSRVTALMAIMTTAGATSFRARKKATRPGLFSPSSSFTSCFVKVDVLTLSTEAIAILLCRRAIEFAFFTGENLHLDMEKIADAATAAGFY